MAKPAKLAPKFGEYLAGIRGGRSLGLIAARIKSKGHGLDATTLWRYERGRVPKIEQLTALADGYGVDLGVLCRTLAAELLGRPIPDAPRPPAPLPDDEAAILSAYRRGSPRFRDALRLLSGEVLPAPPALPAVLGDGQQEADALEPSGQTVHGRPRTRRSHR